MTVLGKQTGGDATPLTPDEERSLREGGLIQSPCTMERVWATLDVERAARADDVKRITEWLIGKCNNWTENAIRQALLRGDWRKPDAGSR